MNAILEKATEKVYTVQKTTDYKKFRYISSNRSIVKRHVQMLVESFDKNPKLIATRPVLVNDDYEVIDGQHRLQACEALQIPVHYIVAPGLDIATAQLMNALQRPWTILDYANSYSLSGNENYRKFLNYLDEYKLPATVLMIFMHGRQAHKLHRDFRGGLFTISEDRDRIQEQLDMLESFGNVFAHWKDYDFAMAAWTIFQIPEYNHKRMLSQMKEQTLTRQPSRKDYLRSMEAIYNRNVLTTKQTRFF